MPFKTISLKMLVTKLIFLNNYGTPNYFHKKQKGLYGFKFMNGMKRSFFPHNGHATESNFQLVLSHFLSLYFIRNVFD